MIIAVRPALKASTIWRKLSVGAEAGVTFASRAQGHVPAVGGERLLGDHAALLEACAAAEHERPPIVEPAGAAAHAEARHVALRQRLRGGEELVEGLRRLQARLLEQVLPVVEVDHHVLQRQVVLLAVRRPC